MSFLTKIPLPPCSVVSILASLRTQLLAHLVIPFPAFLDLLSPLSLWQYLFPSFETIVDSLFSFALVEVLFSALFKNSFSTLLETLFSALLETLFSALLEYLTLTLFVIGLAIMHTFSMQATLGLALLLADTVRTKAVFAHYMVRSRTQSSPEKG